MLYIQAFKPLCRLVPKLSWTEPTLNKHIFIWLAKSIVWTTLLHPRHCFVHCWIWRLPQYKCPIASSGLGPSKPRTLIWCLWLIFRFFWKDTKMLPSRKGVLPGHAVSEEKKLGLSYNRSTDALFQQKLFSTIAHVRDFEEQMLKENSIC